MMVRGRSSRRRPVGHGPNHIPRKGKMVSRNNTAETVKVKTNFTTRPGTIKVINYTPQADTGGQCYRLCKKVNNNYPGYQCKSFIGKSNYIQYPADVVYSRGVKSNPSIKKFWAEASVLHGHIHLRGIRAWPALNPSAGRLVHQHGRLPRGGLIYKNRAEIWAEDDKVGATRIVSTINLLRYIKDGDSAREKSKRWFPTPVDIKWLEGMIPKTPWRKNPDRIRVMHSPTDRGLKHTSLFLKCMERLKKKYDVETVLVENKTHEDTQLIRAGCDIVYDQILLQYGSNALEAWAMGIPVIAGCIDRPGVLSDINEVVGYVPFYNATTETLYNALEELIVNSRTRTQYARLGADYVRKFHSGKAVARRAVETYEEVMRG